ncbi:MAG: hypothetical protein JWM86_2363, partial [Thermoleophilia bacterium]|nr:hypothetical protein [Thermoleophilia bacterium]
MALPYPVPIFRNVNPAARMANVGYESDHDRHRRQHAHR